MEKDSISYTELDFELIKMEVKEMEKLIKQLKVSFTGSSVIIDQLEVEVRNHCLCISNKVSFSGDSDSKESTCNAGDPGSIPGLGRSPGEGNGFPLQYSCLEKLMDRGDWRATVHEVAKNWT